MAGKKKNTEVAEPVSETASAAEVVEMTAPVEINEVLLSAIVDATKSGSFLYVSETESAPLVASGFVEINKDYVDEAGNIATRALPEGVTFMSNKNTETAAPLSVGNSAETPTETPVEKPAEASKPSEFVIVDNVPLPGAIRSGRGGSSYPFEKLPVGGSFFIPDVKDVEGKVTVDASKKYASTVSSATARFAVEVPGEMREKKTLVVDAEGNAVLDEAGKRQYNVELVPRMKPTRQFIIRKIEDGEPWGKPGISGAGIWRTA